MPNFFQRLLPAVCITVFLVGCSSTKPSVDRDPTVPPPPEGIKTQSLPDKNVRVLLPTVEFDNGVMNVSGYVRRKTGNRSYITGRVDVQILDDQGEELDWIPAPLTPRSIPMNGRAESTYIIHYGYIPPVGSTIKVYFVDSKTAVIEDTGDTDSAGGKYGSHSGGSSAGGGGRGHWR